MHNNCIALTCIITIKLARNDVDNFTSTCTCYLPDSETIVAPNGLTIIVLAWSSVSAGMFQS